MVPNLSTAEVQILSIFDPACGVTREEVHEPLHIDLFTGTIYLRAVDLSWDGEVPFAVEIQVPGANEAIVYEAPVQTWNYRHNCRCWKYINQQAKELVIDAP